MKHIVAMTFPKQDLNLGLEPSILTVVPNDTEDVKVHYVLDQNSDIMVEKQEISRFTATTFNDKELCFIVYNDKTIDCPTLGLKNYNKLIIKPRFMLIKPNNYYEYNVRAIKKYVSPPELIGKYNIDESLFEYLKENNMISYSTDMAYLYGFADKNGYDIGPYTPGEKRKRHFKRVKDKSKILSKQRKGIFN